ncbi:hypothetical protein JTB14_033049 [Gonioctena quinquepunctata]|nr:hypothetical protein JTB14_033049 [Gonioctena quinquepunctata]
MKLFITHGGVQSLIESVYHGVPILGMPIWADQKMNVARAAADGYGKYMGISEITKERFSKDVNTLLGDPRYREIAKKRSVLMHDRPMKPKDLAVYWIEFVIRHQGTQHLRVAALDLTWYQYFLLDILAFIMFIRPSGLQETFTLRIPFSPQDIRPVPKAGPRSETRRVGRKLKTAILTEKNAIEKEYNQKNEAKKPIFQSTTGKGKINSPSAKGEGQGKKTKNPLGNNEKENQSTANNNSCDEEECFCLVCLELFSNSLSH